MKKHNCQKDPQRKARAKAAQERQALYDALSPEQQKAQKAANKAEYDSQHKS